MTRLMDEPTLLIVPGLRDAVADHWQTHLEASLRAQGRSVASVAPMGRDDLDCAKRVAAIDAALRAIDAPVIVVAHSGGCVMLAHWAATHGPRTVQAALLATPPDFERPMPAGYPTLDALRAGGWLPVPQERLPFPSILAASRNDPLGGTVRSATLARAWGSRLFDLGAVGHLNPASGYGPWPLAGHLIEQLRDAVLA